MLDLSTIPAETLLARGQYSTVRAAHEDEKKNLAKMCGEKSSIAARILRIMQPDHDDVPDNYAELIEADKRLSLMIEQCCQRIESLAKQKAEIKKLAW